MDKDTVGIIRGIGIVSTVIVAGFATLGCLIYNKGKSDCIHEIYKRGMVVYDKNENPVDYKTGKKIEL